MAGSIELFVDGQSNFRFRLKAPDGTIMAVSAAFTDKSAAVAGIEAVRECAGMGLINDLCPGTGRDHGRRQSTHTSIAAQARHAAFHFGSAADRRQVEERDSHPAAVLARPALPRRAGVIGPSDY